MKTQEVIFQEQLLEKFKEIVKDFHLPRNLSDKLLQTVMTTKGVI